MRSRSHVSALAKPCIAGFTLVELLAVVAIIGVLAAVVLGVRPSGEGYALGNGQRIAASVFQSARSIAVMKQTATRVIIYRAGASGDRNDTAKQLRFMGVVYRDKNASSPRWLPANAGVYLPEGVYFVAPEPDGSSDPYKFVADVDAAMRESKILLLNDGPTPDDPYDFKVSFPTMGGTKDSWFFYEFDQRGLSRNPGALFVIAAGEKVEPLSNDVLYSVSFPNPYAVAGFVVRRVGGVVNFTDYDDIEN